ncbi:hypothetical protein F1C58_07080 [Glaciihabitans sp. INWT7]|uniref:hypothetical protein n=1 Tax=Glaciihabitans sp. INWT7 TaxID=2596912 RepID=UPI001624088D|nr:hypothetical protein [Glaciihabitans sp. INWT7]QNE46692.1 hypothetical protein F1C58_07080 [Glaciihabitans sp. INWT7]
MPWWSWIVIWACLVLALLAMLVFSGWRLFRKAVAVFDELGALGAKLELLDAAITEFDTKQEQFALLQKYSDVQEQRRKVRDASLARKEARRSGRLDRGRALTRIDANSRRWFQAE